MILAHHQTLILNLIQDANRQRSQLAQKRVLKPTKEVAQPLHRPPQAMNHP